MNELAIEEASKEARGHLKEIHSHEIKGKKHPCSTRIKVISQFAERCREAGMPSHEISAFIREQLEEEKKTKIVSNETIDNLSNDYKNQALSTRGRRGREQQLRKPNEINTPKTVQPFQGSGAKEAKAESFSTIFPSPNSTNAFSGGHSWWLEDAQPCHNNRVPTPKNEFGQNTSFVSQIFLPKTKKNFANSGETANSNASVAQPSEHNRTSEADDRLNYYVQHLQDLLFQATFKLHEDAFGKNSNIKTLFGLR